MQSKQYFTKIKNYPHEKSTEPENIGENLSLDETCLSNGDVYTILTNKAAKFSD